MQFVGMVNVLLLIVSSIQSTSAAANSKQKKSLIVRSSPTPVQKSEAGAVFVLPGTLPNRVQKTPALQNDGRHNDITKKDPKTHRSSAQRITSGLATSHQLAVTSAGLPSFLLSFRPSFVRSFVCSFVRSQCVCVCVCVLFVCTLFVGSVRRPRSLAGWLAHSLGSRSAVCRCRHDMPSQ